ncbi:hypothetical protein ACHAXA_008052 [Cyclostephanos tholiformis]|jgi:hypothetical protein|uniref:Uncharacterized protein n=1 Tax=Cyclostephanos tholiformis TaxID=382380 RepID=A0ABD3SDZ9_9STRA
MRALPIGVDAYLPLPLALLLLPLIVCSGASQIPTPVPTYNTNYGDGSESISTGFTRTLEPTQDLAVLTGRGQPSRNPTYPPSNDPTAKDFGTDFTVEIPGVDMSEQPGDDGSDDDVGEEEGTAMPTPLETTSPAPVLQATSPQVPVPVPSGGGSRAARSATGALAVAVAAGCATILLYGHVGQ